MGKIILEIEDDKIRINEIGGMGKPFIMRRDNSEIHQLQKENKELQQKLHIMSEVTRRQDAEVMRRFNRIKGQRDNLREKVEELEGELEFRAATIRELHSKAFSLTHTVSQEKLKVLEESNKELRQHVEKTDTDLLVCRELNKELMRKIKNAWEGVRQQDNKLEAARLHSRYQIKLIEDNRELQQKLDRMNDTIRRRDAEITKCKDSNRAYSTVVVPALHKEIRELKDVIKLHAAVYDLEA